MRRWLLFATIGSASAHTIFQEVAVNGASQGHLEGVRVPDFEGPIYDVTSDDIICNGGPNILKRPFSSKVINVEAGDTVTMYWHRTLDGDKPSDKADPIDPGHVGPTLAYLAKVDNATSEEVTGLKWFKVHEDGWDRDHQWGVTRMYKDRGKVSFEIPECIEDGQYLLRGEVIALHMAGMLGGAQFYMSCAQLNITGGGKAKPPTVSFPGAYKPNDPGILFQLYYPPPKKYIIPGPPVFKCGYKLLGKIA